MGPSFWGGLFFGGWVVDQVLQAVRAAGKVAVLPRFRALGAGEVAQKSDFADLVTVADTEAEAMIGALLAQSWPAARVLGEEAVAADPSLRAAMAGPGWQVIVDPVDGTWNFAKGISTFGMIAVAVRDGVAQYGLLYDPLLDDWVEVTAGGPARFVQADGRAQVLAVSQVCDPAQMCGFIPVGLFEPARKRAAVLAGLAYGRVTSLRCSCHEYRLMAQGHVEFVISGPHPHPWDHAAGVLAVQAAGGVARFLDGAAYDLARREGVLLVANSEATWSRVARDYAALAD
ncbi:MAG: inositol phosphatase [Pseudorhodobacter sp. PARRP1]|nr:MAG: inositol phosphatase [Pseudorhodobacter sp. PARRP1]